MQRQNQTLLAKLAPIFGHQTENIAVEALGHILSESEAARRALSDVLRTDGEEVGKIARVKTQVSGEEGTRPDLAGFDQHTQERVLIEAKFWAGLTDNQPVAYLKRLPENQASALLFVAPSARLDALWAELCRKVSESESGIELGPDRNEAEGLRSATAGGKRRLMLTSWAELLDRMDSQVSIAGESHTECNIQQLRGLAEQMDEDAFLPLRPGELGSEIPRRLISLENLVNHVIERLEREELAADSGNLYSLRTEYGYAFKLSGAGAWFGIDHDKWATVRDTPLWLYLYGEGDRWQGVKPFSEIRDNLKPLGLKTPPELFDEFADNELVIPIYLPVGVAADAVLEAVVERIEEIGKLL